MPYNGSGVFTRSMNWVSDAVAGIKIRADRHDLEDDNFAGGLSNVICRDGQSVITANIPFWWETMRNDSTSSYESTAGISILGLLVVIGGFFLLFTKRYPQGLFDFVLGLNRWLYRVITYVALMRDEYPPFRLDQGQHEPGDAEPEGPTTRPDLVTTPA